MKQYMVMGLLLVSLMQARAVYADWAIQVASSNRFDLLQQQAEVLPSHWEQVRILHIDHLGKLVVGQWKTTREASPALAEVRKRYPDAFLRAVGDEANTVVSAAKKVVPAAPRIVEPVLVSTVPTPKEVFITRTCGLSASLIF